MEFENNRDIIILDFDSKTFINDFIKIYNDIELLKNISNNSYECMKKNYSLEKNEEYIKNMFKLFEY
jgi:hypothetical protein